MYWAVISGTQQENWNVREDVSERREDVYCIYCLYDGFISNVSTIFVEEL